MQKLIWDDAPWVWLDHNVFVTGKSKKLQGELMAPSQIIRPIGPSVRLNQVQTQQQYRPLLVDPAQDPERARALISKLTTAACEAVEAPKESVRVVVREVPATHWAAGDETIAERKARQGGTP